MKHSNKLTEGPIVKSLLSLAVPIVLANILQTAYQLVDTFWVGRLGQNAVAAVSLSFPIIFLLMSIGGGLAIAGTILVAQYKGAGKHEKIDYVSAQTILVMLLISLAISIFGFLAGRWILILIGAGPQVLGEAASYLQITFLGMPFLFGYIVFQSLLRGIGEVKIPFFIVLGTVILNAILDPLFIMGYGPIQGYGVNGAAMATVGTQGIAALIGLFILIRGYCGIRLRARDFKPDFRLISRMFKLGFPASLEQSSRALGLTIMTALVASFGTLGVATYGIGTKILSLVFMISIGMSMSTSTLVGQNIGAGKKNRAIEIVKKSSVMTFAILTFCGIFIFMYASILAAVFIPNEPETIASSANFIKIIVFSFGFIGIQQVLNGALRGAGNTVTPLILALISSWVLQFPIAFVLSKHMGMNGLWWSIPISNIIALAITGLYVANGKWTNTKFTHERELEKEVTEESIIEEGI
ncbi:MATE family efflux transporter [Candidatus Peregrinibacteria bacterium]|nr:MATE family efflux transporter [Candidatus Peregrinibacteria bacterium]